MILFLDKSVRGQVVNLIFAGNDMLVVVGDIGIELSGLGIPLDEVAVADLAVVDVLAVARSLDAVEEERQDFEAYDLAKELKELETKEK